MSMVKWEDRLRGWEVLRQAISLSGRVAELKTGKGIERVELVVESPKTRNTAISRMDGRFHFCDLSEGEYDLTVTFPIVYGKRKLAIEVIGFIEKDGRIEPMPEKDHKSAHIEVTESYPTVKAFTIQIGS